MLVQDNVRTLPHSLPPSLHHHHVLANTHAITSYIVLPFYPMTLKRLFHGYIDAIVGAPSNDAATALLPDEREVLLLMVQLCAALVHLQSHHVVHRDIKVC